MKVPGGGSDHRPFLVYMAIPVVDFRYANESGTQYPLYHTLYETPYVNEHLFDRDNFAIHRAVGQYWAELARSFADANIIPLNITIFAKKLIHGYVSDLKQNMEPFKNLPEAKDATIQLDKLVAKSQEFLSQAENFDSIILNQSLDDFELSGPNYSIPAINRRLKAVDRCFLNPRGMKESSLKRHVLFSMSGDDTYSGVVMAAVYQQIENVKDAKTAEQKIKAGRELAIQISVVQYSVQCAINTLNHHV